MVKITLSNGNEYYSDSTVEKSEDAIHSTIKAGRSFISIKEDDRTVSVPVNMIEEIAQVKSRSYSARLSVNIDTDKLIDGLVLKIADLLKEQSRNDYF